MNQSVINFPRGQETLETIHRDLLNHRLFRRTVLDVSNLFDFGDHKGMTNVPK